MTTTEWCEVNGTVLRVQHRPGTGATFVLLHEMGGSLESWDDVVARLPAEAGVLRYDLRGAGLSEKLVEPCSADTLVADLLALLDRCGMQAPIVLAGVAVGAAVAMLFACRHPARVARLLALAPACGVPAAARVATAERGRAIARQGMRGEALALLERAYPAALRTDAARYECFRRRWLANDARSLGAIYGMLAAMDLDDTWPALPPRSVLVAGHWDPLRPPAEIGRLAALAPQAEALHVASGHFMAVQSPAWVAALLQHTRAEPGAAARPLYERFMQTPAHRVGAAGHAA